MLDRQDSFFDPSYTSDGLTPDSRWGNTRHALTATVARLIEGGCTNADELERASAQLRRIGTTYGEALQARGFDRDAVRIACSALRGAFDDAAEWIARRRALNLRLTYIVGTRVETLARRAAEQVVESYESADAEAIDAAPSRPAAFDVYCLAASIGAVPFR